MFKWNEFFPRDPPFGDTYLPCSDTTMPPYNLPISKFSLDANFSLTKRFNNKNMSLRKSFTYIVRSKQRTPR